ncbi:hypothetical protein FACS1894140_1810 [Spirochaetia bacterium]|nr:hypothetical protein FACS1894140_1810 [Spirochaetia bacterium]
MRQKNIVSIQGFITYVKENSSWSPATIKNVITSLGHKSAGSMDRLKELSTDLTNCAEHGANSGFCGFSYYCDTIPFFRQNRKDIVKNLEIEAEELGEDIIKMVRCFGIFRHETPPAPAKVGRAIWDTGKTHDDLSTLYNVFSWFCLEEISNTWYRYLEDNPVYRGELSA